MPVKRVVIASPPYQDRDRGKEWDKRGVWPCSWVACRGTEEPPFACAFRLRFRLTRRTSFRAHISADERYELYLDGEFTGRGSERGDRENWYFETYDFDLNAGSHTIVARVWSLGTGAPFAQMSVRPGFIFSPEGEFAARLGTGRAKWQAKVLTGHRFTSPEYAWGTGMNIEIDGGRFPWGFEQGKGESWKPVTPFEPGGTAGRRNETAPIHFMRPGTLPAQLDEARSVGQIRFLARAGTKEAKDVPVRAADHLAGEAEHWSWLLKGRAPLTIPARTRRRIVVDLGDYYCARPELVISGGKGGSVRILWAESLYETPEDPEGWPPNRRKGNRDQVEGKYFSGVGDLFRPDGGKRRRFTTLWWQAGRYLEILVETDKRSLHLDSFHLRETRYPLEMQGKFDCDDSRLTEFLPIGVRALKMCSHETYMDCPYYEQLMYVGDTRLEALTTYTLTRDSRLPRKAIRIFDVSRLPAGITQSRYPSRVRQVIPPFSLWWIGMVYDHALWRGGQNFTRSLMPGVRSVIDWFLATRNREGLVEAPDGWNYMDWVPEWKWGIPPDASEGASGIINFQLVLALDMAARLEEWIGEPEMARRADRMAEELAGRAAARFWDEGRGLIADDLKKTRFSEHAQCLALLSRRLDADRRRRTAHGLLEDPDLARTTIYFSHYLFETCRLLGRMDVLFKRMKLWFDLKGQGFKTTLESPEPSRSDCHAWGAHPIYHFYATLAGIRPSSFGFNTVVITPRMGHLKHVRARLPHPKGFIDVALKLEKGRLRSSISLPPGVTGSFLHAGHTRRLSSGMTSF